MQPPRSTGSLRRRAGHRRTPSGAVLVRTIALARNRTNRTMRICRAHDRTGKPTPPARSGRTTRHGRHAGEHVVAAARAIYNRAIADGLIDQNDSPAHRVVKPRQLPNTRRALTDWELDWGWLHGATQRYAVAVPAFTKAVEITEQSGLPAMLTEAVRELALVARYQGDFSGADECRRSPSRHRAAGDVRRGVHRDSGAHGSAVPEPGADRSVGFVRCARRSTPGAGSRPVGRRPTGRSPRDSPDKGPRTDAHAQPARDRRR